MERWFSRGFLTGPRLTPHRPRRTPSSRFRARRRQCHGASATGANRWPSRWVHLVTLRPTILVFSHGYHGIVDQTFTILDPWSRHDASSGALRARGGFDDHTRVVEFTDLEGLERGLRHGEVTPVVTEPALSDIGIVLHEPGFFDGARRLWGQTATLLKVDESHPFSAGPGGATRRFELRPDALTIGESLGGDVPSGAYGLSQEMADRSGAHLSHGSDTPDADGVDETLAGSATSLAATRAVLGEVLTDGDFAKMEILCTQFAQGVSDAIASHALASSVSQFGTRINTVSRHSHHVPGGNRPPVPTPHSSSTRTSAP